VRARLRLSLRCFRPWRFSQPAAMIRWGLLFSDPHRHKCDGMRSTFNSLLQPFPYTRASQNNTGLRLQSSVPAVIYTIFTQESGNMESGGDRELPSPLPRSRVRAAALIFSLLLVAIIIALAVLGSRVGVSLNVSSGVCAHGSAGLQSNPGYFTSTSGLKF
jgi:hypothetical protein